MRISKEGAAKCTPSNEAHAYGTRDGINYDFEPKLTDRKN